MAINASIYEVNFDCLVGPTHNFAGLSQGNIASMSNKMRLANPKKAALQGLEKMRFLAERGFKQAILAPHPRPHMKSLKTLGFNQGADHEILRIAYKECPEAFFAALSSSAMWAANAATVSPKLDCLDQKTHITQANLLSMYHRSLEPCFATKMLRKIFNDERFFLVHDPLPAHDIFSDEGAANHNRLAKTHADIGLEIFVFGKEAKTAQQKSKVYPSRQAKKAQEAIKRLHKLKEENTFFIEQNPKAIDQGAFHNDVVAVSNESILLCHEEAFLNQSEVLSNIKKRYVELYHEEPCIIQIKKDLLPLKDAISSYFFNSQLLSKKDGKMMLFAPMQCQSIKSASLAIDEILAMNTAIDEVQFFDVSESMANGGGPACLRLRVLLNDEELNHIKQSVLFSPKLYEELSDIINRFYVDDLSLETLFDPSFLSQARAAEASIAEVLDLADIYEGW